MKNLNEVASQFFEQNPHIDKIYVSSDGFVFVTKNYAELHKRSAGAKYQEFIRPDDESKNVNPEQLTKEELKALLQEKGIEFKPKSTKSELLELLFRKKKGN